MMSNLVVDLHIEAAAGRLGGCIGNSGGFSNGHYSYDHGLLLRTNIIIKNVIIMMMLMTPAYTDKAWHGNCFYAKT